MHGTIGKLMAGMLIMTMMSGVFGTYPAFAAKAAEQAKPEATTNNPVEGYRIGPGDVLSISVWNNQELTKVVKVLPDGTISFPLIGEITVLDMTVSQVAKSLREKLEPYASDPQLSVEVQQTNSLLVYVIGKVNRPGHFPYSGNIDALQALAMAGGLNPFAKRSDIKIMRTEKDGKKEFSFDYDAVIEGKGLNQNIQLKRGDVVVVP